MLALNQQLTAEQRLEKAYLDITSQDRYLALATVISIGDKTISNDIPTACTNGRDEIYGRAFVDSLNDAELRFVMLHECYHKMFRHLITWKHLNDKNHSLANASCDFNINGRLVDENKGDGFATMPRDVDGNQIGLFDEQYRDGDGWLDPATIFKMLEQQRDQPQGNKSDGDGPQGTSSAQPQGFDEHDWDGAAELSEAETRELAQEIESAIRQGALVAGKLGSEGNRNLQELMEPQVDWREVLHDFVQSTCTGSDYSTWSRPSRRHLAADIYMPSTYAESVDELLIAVDTSGSIDDIAVAAFMSEVQSICSTLKPEKVRLLYWGHRIAGDEVYEGEAVNTLVGSTRVKHGGGTDVECVTAYMSEHDITPQAAIILTDGDLWGTWGTWNCPTLWCVLDNKRATPDNGKVVHIKTSDM
mgnify:CR=1 FL=1